MNHIPGLDTLEKLSGWKFAAVWTLVLIAVATPVLIAYCVYSPLK